MNTDKDTFSEALDPENEDNWVPFLQAKVNNNRADIYRINIPGSSTQTLKATVFLDEDDVLGYVELAPNTSEYPTLRVPIRYVEQYCPAPTLPTDTLSEIYNVEASIYDGTLKFARMILDFDGDWIGVDSEEGEAHYIRPKDILEFSVTPEKP